MNATNEAYWSNYDGLQNAKHQLLNRYLSGWLPILGSWNGRVLYIDCHAGRGRHNTGDEGSPILALRLLLDHRLRRRILADTEVHYFFFEIDEFNYQELLREIDTLGDLPDNVFIHPYQQDYEAQLRAAIHDLDARGREMAPSFAFIDPFGFSISMNFLDMFLRFQTSEILINFMFRYIDMAIHQNAQVANMDALFGCQDWRGLAEIEDPDRRSQATIALFSHQLSAKYVTHMNMIGENNALKYVLIHASNHARGRELMKDAMWSVVPDGSFRAYERNSPEQLVLIEAEPDLRVFREDIVTTFQGSTAQMETLYEWLLGQVYTRVHLHQALRELRDSGKLGFRGYEGRFAFSKNPTIDFF